jgi:hypothetical protein
MPEYVEYVRLRLKGKDLDDVVNSITVTSSTPTKVVSTMNKKREGRGYKQANVTHTLELDTERIFDPTLPDWEQIHDQRIRFGLVETPSVGKPTSYLNCVVTNIVRGASDGDSSLRVSVTALRKIT